MLGAEVTDQHLKSNQMGVNRRDKLKNTAVIQCSEQKATRLTTGSDRSICPGSLRARLAKPNKQGDMTNMSSRPGIFMRLLPGRLAGALTLVLPIFCSPRASGQALNSTPATLFYFHNQSGTNNEFFYALA